MHGETVANVSSGDRLAGLLDKLVSARLDLRPICRDGKDDLPPGARSNVTEACNVLHAVIADLVAMLKDPRPPLPD